MPETGLSEEEVLNLRQKFGENVLPEKEEFSTLELLVNQFKNPLIYILLSMKFLIATVSLFAGLLSLIFFLLNLKQTGNLALSQTLAFTILARADLIYVFSFKNLKKPIFKTENFFQNKYLFWGVLYAFLLIFVALYLPLLNKFLGTVPLNLSHWLIILTTSLLVTLLIEIIKFVKSINKTTSTFQI